MPEVASAELVKALQDLQGDLKNRAIWCHDRMLTTEGALRSQYTGLYEAYGNSRVLLEELLVKHGIEIP